MKTYLINLNSRTDRLLVSTNQAARFDLNLERIPAIDSDIFDFEFVTPSVGACFESHRKAWSVIANSDIDFALILEDDFEFTKLNLNALKLILADNQIDLLQLGFLKTGFRDYLDYFLTNSKHVLILILKLLTQKFDFRKLKHRVLLREVMLNHPTLVPSNFRAGAHSYVISRSMARSLVRLNLPVFLAADDFLISLARMRAFKIYRNFRSNCRQLKSPTSIISRFKNVD
jgi:GR25 family glycosyltransferase involved in LPS biosynthesis